MRTENFKRFFASIIFTAIAVVTYGTAKAEEKTFGQWHASCDDAAYCHATLDQNLAPAAPPYRFTIGRHAEETYWELSLDTRSAPAGSQEYVLVNVDSWSEIFTPEGEVASYGEQGALYFLGDKAQTLMDRLTVGNEMRFDFNDQNKAARTARFNLEGLSTALIWIDEQQSRLGSERVVSVPPHNLAMVTDSKAAIPAELLARLAADDECQARDPFSLGLDIITDTLGNNEKLYILPCWASVYNFGWKVFVERDGVFRGLAFAEYSPQIGWSGRTSLPNIGYDSETKTLKASYDAGGSDCGSKGIWQWHEYTFRLLEFRFKECGVQAGAPAETGEFPIIFKFEEQPLPAD